MLSLSFLEVKTPTSWKYKLPLPGVQVSPDFEPLAIFLNYTPLTLDEGFQFQGAWNQVRRLPGHVARLLALNRQFEPLDFVYERN